MIHSHSPTERELARQRARMNEACDPRSRTRAGRRLARLWRRLKRSRAG